MKDRVFEICDFLESKGMKVTADNVITESLFSKGGTVTDKRWVDLYVRQYLADKHPTQHALMRHGQDLDDFKAFTSPVDGVVFMVCEKFMKQRHIDKMRAYLNELGTKITQQ